MEGVVNILIFLLSLTNEFRSVVIKQTLSRSDAAEVIERDILPQNEYGQRISLGCKAQDLDPDTLLIGNDPILSETYGEFPLQSLDTLLDYAEKYIQMSAKPERQQQQQQQQRRTVLDLGSGCGRLAIYMALSRPLWDVYGIEISSIYHQETINACQRGVLNGYLLQQQNNNKNDDSNINNGYISLLLGSAEEYCDIINKADVIFCYSTAFDSPGFSVDAKAAVLNQYWSELLSISCNPNCICITTDKALDPQYGWEILERIEVPNREVFGSTGYIQRLSHRSI